MTDEASIAPPSAAKPAASFNPVPRWIYWVLVIGLAFIAGFSVAAYVFSNLGGPARPAEVAGQPDLAFGEQPTADKATAVPAVSQSQTEGEDPRGRLYTYDEVMEMLYGSVPITAPAAFGFTTLHRTADGDPAIGSEDAPVTIVEYSDFSCSFCRRFRNETLNQLLEAYGDQIRFVYRDFPILGEGSLYAAEAANCADAQGRFWEFHDFLFANPGTFHNLGLSAIAYRMGLDLNAFQACLDSDDMMTKVQTDFNAAREVGATGTPTFSINGEVLVGAQPLEQFKSVIDAKLAEASN